MQRIRLAYQLDRVCIDHVSRLVLAIVKGLQAARRVERPGSAAASA